VGNSAHALLGNEYGLLDDGHITINDISGDGERGLSSCHLQLYIKAPIGVLYEFLLTRHGVVRKQNKLSHHNKRMAIDDEHPGFKDTPPMRIDNYINCYESVGDISHQTNVFGAKHGIDNKLSSYNLTLANYTDFAIIFPDAYQMFDLIRECSNVNNSHEFSAYIDTLYHIAGKWLPDVTVKLFPEGLVYG
jgi:hypothetical protein